MSDEAVPVEADERAPSVGVVRDMLTGAYVASACAVGIAGSKGRAAESSR